MQPAGTFPRKFSFPAENDGILNRILRMPQKKNQAANVERAGYWMAKKGTEKLSRTSARHGWTIIFQKGFSSFYPRSCPVAGFDTNYMKILVTGLYQTYLFYTNHNFQTGIVSLGRSRSSSLVAIFWIFKASPHLCFTH